MVVPKLGEEDDVPFAQGEDLRVRRRAWAVLGESRGRVLGGCVQVDARAPMERMVGRVDVEAAEGLRREEDEPLRATQLRQEGVRAVVVQRRRGATRGHPQAQRLRFCR